MRHVDGKLIIFYWCVSMSINNQHVFAINLIDIVGVVADGQS